MAEQPTSSFAKRVLILLAVALGVLLLVWYANLALLVFGGVLVAVAIDGLIGLIGANTSLARPWAFAIAVVFLLLVFVGLGWLIGPPVAKQVPMLADQIPEAFHSLKERVQQYSWGKRLLANLPSPSELFPTSGEQAKRVYGFFSTAFGALSSIPIVIFIGLYLAYNPTLYTESFVRLVPPRHRERAREVLRTLGHSLRRWVLGRLTSMAAVGLLSGVALWLLGIPLALALGLLTALLAFVPYVGAILSAIPAVLLGLLQSPMHALYVILAYVGVQTIEGYLITPFIEQRVVSMPPALLIFAQIVMGFLVGALGVLLASPIALVAVILVQMIYIRDALGDPIHVLGQPVEEPPG